MKRAGRTFALRLRNAVIVLLMGIFTQAKVLAKWGPRGLLRYWRLRPQSPTHVFGQGLTAGLNAAYAERWFLADAKPVAIALIGVPPESVAEWMTLTRRMSKALFLVAPDTVPFLAGVDRSSYLICAPLGESEPSFFAIKDWLMQHLAKCDLLLLDSAQPLPHWRDVIQLQHAAYQYDRGQQEIGFVSPALKTGDDRILGYEWDRRAMSWASRQPDDDHGQGTMPRYVLAANGHGLYSAFRALDQVRFGSADARGLDFDEQVRRMIALAWQQNIRTLAVPSVELVSSALSRPEVSQFDRDWLTGRPVMDEAGRRRVIFVLSGTSISGGIRTVFEQADGFAALGFAVEIWAVGPQPDWFDLHVRVRTFRSFFDMIPALRNEEAIKVATWWETAEVVWLSSVNAGVAVNYAQEFETWFYPADPVARAAVASSYRMEMEHLTIATYQQQELAGIGIEATYIPSCFDARKFRVLPDAVRSDTTVMALGRSFFQKNFTMTAAAWSSLGERRPLLSLYGFEPDIVVDERVHYEVRPSDERINVLYNEATVFVQTSLHEGFSLPLIEAMAAGCPVITTDSHGNRDFCRDGENCVVVQQHDADGLAEAIVELLGDSERRSRLAAAGLETAAGYSQDVIFHRLEEFYSQLA